MWDDCFMIYDFYDRLYDFKAWIRAEYPRRPLQHLAGRRAGRNSRVDSLILECSSGFI